MRSTRNESGCAEKWKVPFGHLRRHPNYTNSLLNNNSLTDSFRAVWPIDLFEYLLDDFYFFFFWNKYMGHADARKLLGEQIVIWQAILGNLAGACRDVAIIHRPGAHCTGKEEKSYYTQMAFSALFMWFDFSHFCDKNLSLLWIFHHHF